MTFEQDIQTRSQGNCELCTSNQNTSTYEVQPTDNVSADSTILVCQNCKDQILESTPIESKHWFCLKDSMWSATLAVQIMAYRLLGRLSAESWARELLDQLYLDDDAKAWAEAGLVDKEENATPTVDSNGTALSQGDSVTLIKDLNVKGANFTAKRGTMVKNISLTDDPGLIEGRVNGTQIVLVTAYLKKA